MEQTLLQVRGLVINFGGIVAADGVDLDVRDGENRPVICGHMPAPLPSAAGILPPIRRARSPGSALPERSRFPSFSSSTR
jgi:hypothetical protein